MKSTPQYLTFQVAPFPPEPRGAVLASMLVMALVRLGRRLGARGDAKPKVPVGVSPKPQH